MLGWGIGLKHVFNSILLAPNALQSLKRKGAIHYFINFLQGFNVYTEMNTVLCHCVEQQTNKKLIKA
jgi:hypothetical protein